MNTGGILGFFIAFGSDEGSLSRCMIPAIDVD